MKLFKLLLLILILNSCGDTGEKFADAVEKLRGDKHTIHKVNTDHKTSKTTKERHNNQDKKIDDQVKENNVSQIKLKQDVKDAISQSKKTSQDTYGNKKEYSDEKTITKNSFKKEVKETIDAE